MNNEQTPNQPEKAPLDERKKNALFRYIAIMFAVAFLFVLASMFSQMRSNEATISQLNQSSSSALQKAEQLQDTNRQLETDKAYLEGRIEELEKNLEEQKLAREEAEERAGYLENILGNLETRIADAESGLEQTTKAYELLLQADSLIAAEEDASAVLKELEAYKPYLGKHALKILENLSKEGENHD